MSQAEEKGPAAVSSSREWEAREYPAGGLSRAEWEVVRAMRSGPPPLFVNALGLTKEEIREVETEWDEQKRWADLAADARVKGVSLRGAVAPSSKVDLSEEPPGIWLAFGEVDRAVERLGDVSAALIRRIDPVTKPLDDASASPSPARPDTSLLRRKLTEIADRIHYHVNTLETVSHAIEL